MSTSVKISPRLRLNPAMLEIPSGSRNNPPVNLPSYTGLSQTRQFAFSRHLSRSKTPSEGFREWLPARFPTMIWDARHQQMIYDVLDRVTSGEVKKLIITLPPRHFKSETVTIRYAAWRLINNPDMRVIIGSYNQTLAVRFSRRIRNIVRDEIAISTERKAADDWETGGKGGLRAVGVGGGITGVGGDLIIIDDPVKSREEADSPAFRERLWDWYTDDLYTRREPGAAIVLIMTRWHMDDLAGRILASDDAPNWEVVHIPAIALEDDPLGRQPGEALMPERYDVDALADIRATLGDRGWYALYQGMPQPEGGAIFLREWWDNQNRFDPRQTYSPVARIIYWDTAEEDDKDAAFTVGAVFELDADYTARLVDVVRQRVTFPDLVPLIERTAKRHNRDGLLRAVDVEYASSGRQAYQTIMAQSPSWLRRIMRRSTPRSSKEIRAQAAAAWCQVGMVLLPMPDASVPWLHDLEQELWDFPTGTYKDQVDAFSGGINRMKQELTHGFRQRRVALQSQEAA